MKSFVPKQADLGTQDKNKKEHAHLHIHPSLKILAGVAVVVPLLFLTASTTLSKTESPKLLAQVPTEALGELQILPTPDPNANNSNSYHPIPQGNYPGLSQNSRAMILTQYGILNQMNICVQRKRQLYSRIINLTRQVRQLEDQRTVVDDTAYRASNDRRIAALQAQSEALTRSIDRINDAISHTQTVLDNDISRCNDVIYAMQDRQDDLQDNIRDDYDNLVEYRMP